MSRDQAAISVKEAMNAAKRSLETVRVRVVGEVAEFNDKPGYKAAYFSVSDEGATMPCLMWRDRYAASGVLLRNGMLVELEGYFSAYVPKGRMQFTVNALRAAGEGELRLQVAALAKKLELEGLMSPARKRSLPSHPERIALVTSPRGKAVHDVLRTLRRRYPLAEVVLAGVAVEGEGAPQAIAHGLGVAAAAGPDVILLVRGGGSYEDLMPFNSEVVARAVSVCPVPVVTGIGHEPDTTIADMVSDLRASTPTAAAEAVAPSVDELRGRMAVDQRRLARALSNRLTAAEHRVERLVSRPLFSDPMTVVGSFGQGVDMLGMRLHKAIPEKLDRDARRIDFALQRLEGVGSRILIPFTSRQALLASRLHDLSPLAILGRGFSVVYDVEGRIVRSVSGVDSGSDLKIRVSDGIIAASVSHVVPHEDNDNHGGHDE